MSILRRAAARVARALMRLAYPDYVPQKKQLAALTRLVTRIDEQARAGARLQKTQLAALARTLDRLPTREELRTIQREIGETRGVLDRHARVTAKLLRRGEARSEETREERRVLQRLERIAGSRRPILVGPWSGEVGFELLYWIPFVHWFRQKYDIDPDRLVILSRGGVSSWYSHVSTRYIEAFRHISTSEFRDATTLVKKQRGVTRLDVSLLRRVLVAEPLGRVHLLHPQAMYRLFWQFWKESVSVRRVEQYTSFAPLRAADAAADLPPGLPHSFVAVRFYFSSCFPDTPANRAFVGDVVESIAAVTDVVLLNTPFDLDDHADYAVAARARVHTIPEMTPERNLAIQTAVIRRARAFIGTYGGYAYLAPLCGVPSVAFYSTREFFQHHLDLAQRMVASLGDASLVVLDTRDAEVLRIALQHTGAVTRSTGASL